MLHTALGKAFVASGIFNHLSSKKGIPMKTVKKPDVRVLLTIAGQAAAHAQTWSKASAETLRGLMEKFYGVKMSPRTWHRHYHTWEKLGALEVRHRITRGRTGRLELKSNITVLKLTALQLLSRMHRACALAMQSPALNLAFGGMPKMAFSGTSSTSSVVYTGENSCIKTQNDQGALSRALENLRKNLVRRR